MKIKFSFLFVSLVILSGLAAISFTFKTNSENTVSSKGKQALEYCQKNGMNTDFCILVDMNIHSGKNRFFVYQFKNDSVLQSGLCAHGCCDEPWGEDNTKETPLFSNVPESHCSSLGKYKIGGRGYSNWGINVNYKLHGLDATNSKAYARIIVLHSWIDIQENEVYPNGTPEGWGCPAVSNKLMKYVDAKLKKANKSVLFWVYR